MQRLTWTLKEEEILKLMVAGGKMPEDIIKILKSRSINSVKNKAYGMGLSFGGPAPEIDMDEYARFMKGETKCL